MLWDAVASLETRLQELRQRTEPALDAVDDVMLLDTSRSLRRSGILVESLTAVPPPP
jgi:hypothetical protein